VDIVLRYGDDFGSSDQEIRCLAMRDFRSRARSRSAAIAIFAMVLAAAFATCAHARDPGTVKLEASQLGAIKVGTVGSRDFSAERSAVGTIDFNQNMSVQVFSPYQGRIVEAYADLGDAVKKGQILYTLESPDFIAAQSTLIAAAATSAQTASALNRAKGLYARHDMDQNDYETAVAAESTAEGALRAARSALAVFGKNEAEIDRIVATRKVESALVVKSPIAGHITARSAAPGQLVQPGTAPAPFAVADTSTKWMDANAEEIDSTQIHAGQTIRATVLALPGRVFVGKVSRLGRSLDPNTHRLAVRCEIADPDDELIAGMLANFTIEVQAPKSRAAVPVNGVVRNGDGSYSAWVASDKNNFTERFVKIGEEQDGFYPIEEGLKPGETVVTDGAVFISNILYAPPSD
jgi:cobalt-zinc-cadmium efflux system membrane fusion protein